MSHLLTLQSPAPHLTLLQQEAEALVQHRPGEVLGGHLASAPAGPGLVKDAVLGEENVIGRVSSALESYLESSVGATQLSLC